VPGLAVAAGTPSTPPRRVEAGDHVGGSVHPAPSRRPASSSRGLARPVCMRRSGRSPSVATWGVSGLGTTGARINPRPGGGAARGRAARIGRHAASCPSCRRRCTREASAGGIAWTRSPGPSGHRAPTPLVPAPNRSVGAIPRGHARPVPCRWGDVTRRRPTLPAHGVRRPGGAQRRPVLPGCVVLRAFEAPSDPAPGPRVVPAPPLTPWGQRDGPGLILAPAPPRAQSPQAPSAQPRLTRQRAGHTDSAGGPAHQGLAHPPRDAGIQDRAPPSPAKQLHAPCTGGVHEGLLTPADRRGCPAVTTPCVS
jgi:hypothetical protein